MSTSLLPVCVGGGRRAMLFRWREREGEGKGGRVGGIEGVLFNHHV